MNSVINLICKKKGIGLFYTHDVKIHGGFYPIHFEFVGWISRDLRALQLRGRATSFREIDFVEGQPPLIWNRAWLIIVTAIRLDDARARKSTVRHSDPPTRLPKSKYHSDRRIIREKQTRFVVIEKEYNTLNDSWINAVRVLANCEKNPFRDASLSVHHRRTETFCTYLHSFCHWERIKRYRIFLADLRAIR